MDLVQLNANVVLSGNCLGAAANPNRFSPIAARLSFPFASTATGGLLIDQLIDDATEPRTFAAGSTTDIDLSTGQVDPLGDAISGADDFAKVRFWLVYHDPDSASSGIVVGNAASDKFEGPLSTGATLSLAPDEGFVFFSKATAGWAVDGTHKVIRVVNSDGSDPATVWFLTGGSK
jgi:hypothetical protein